MPPKKLPAPIKKIIFITEFRTKIKANEKKVIEAIGI
jgi:hypothetical protein